MSLIPATCALLLATAAAAEEAPAPAGSEQAAPAEVEPGEGVERAAPDDLHGGHLFLSAGGGLWVPSAEIVPAEPELGEIGAGGGTRFGLGIGINRYLTLRADGGFARATGDAACEGCAITSVDIGGGLAYHLVQGLALDPWVSYGLGYRHAFLSLSASDPEVSAFDVARLGLGADYYPVPAIGFGPYLEVDVGLRDAGDGVLGYGIFQLGARVAFDPFRGGTTVGPSTARR